MKPNYPVLIVLGVFALIAVFAVWLMQSAVDFERAQNPNRDAELSNTLFDAQAKYLASNQADYTEVTYLSYPEVSPAMVYDRLNHECDVYKVASFTYVEIPLEILRYKANSVVQVFYTGNGNDTAIGSYYAVVYKVGQVNTPIDPTHPFWIDLTCNH